VAAASRLEGVARVLLDQEDAGAGGVHCTDAAEDLLDDDRREAERGFVHAKEARLGHEGAREGEHLLLAARKRAGGLRGALAQAGKACHGTLEERVYFFSVLPIFEAAHLEVLAHGERR